MRIRTVSSSCGSRDRVSTLSLAPKAAGAFLALAAGDALGWPQEISRNVKNNPAGKRAHIEFKEWTRRSGGRFRPYVELIRPGDYSDDTQLTLAVARSRTNHGSAWWKAFTQVELPLWTLYERGGGGATKRAAHAWAAGNKPWKVKKRDSVDRYFAAGGNGVAMRVLPHALFYAEQENPDPLMHDVILDGLASHGHPRALVGAMAYAYAAWSLARRNDTLRFGELLDMLIDEAPGWSRFPQSEQDGSSWLKAAHDATDARYDQIWEQTAGEMLELLVRARKGLQAGVLANDRTVLQDLGCFGRAKGAGTRSAAAAAYLATRYAAQPEQGILTAAFERGADTDTLAAMVGGLMGCLAGMEWLPRPWLQVQDAECLRHFASRIALGSKGMHQHSITPLRNPRCFLSALARNEGQTMDLGDAHRVKVNAVRTSKPLGNSIAVRTWRLLAVDGQTMYVTEVERRAPKLREKTDSERYTSNGAETVAPRPAQSGGNDLYPEFRWRLQRLLETADSMEPEEIGDELGLVSSQVDKWLRQSEREGQIRLISTKPRKFALQSPSLL